MPNKSIVTISFALLFSFLFYKQNIGVNISIYTSLFITLLWYLFKESFQKKHVWFISIGALLSSIGCLIHGSDLALWSTIISLLTLIGIVHGKQSILYSIITAFYSMITSIVFVFIDRNKNEKKSPIYVLSFIIPITLIIIFFLLYREINPLFEELTKEIALDKISIPLLFFTFCGFLIVLSLFHFKSFLFIDNYLNQQKNNIEEQQFKSSKWNESLAFILLFLVINIMLIAVNIMDINYLYLGSGLPEGVTHKQFVHKGVGMLIFSILLGIAILLFFFRGELNFKNNTRITKLLAQCWIIQNIFMIFSTVLRNNIYVVEALLSYKRIGVYFWLFFAVIGLVFMVIKIHKNKTMWFLIKNNVISAFIVLVLISLINWDTLITNYNLKRANEMTDISSIDKNYLLSLSETNIAKLYSQVSKEGFQKDPYYSYSMNESYSNKNDLDLKLFSFLEEKEDKDWQSFSFMRKRVFSEIEELHNKGKITSLDLRRNYIKSLIPIHDLTNLSIINLSNTGFNENDDFSSLNKFKLVSLLLNNNYISNLDTLISNNKLVSLFLNQNQLTKLDFLHLFKNLDTLTIDDNKIMQLSNISKGHKLKYLSINKNPLNDISDLKNLDKLEYLSCDNILNNAGKLPVLNHLKRLEAIQSPNFIKYALKSETIYPSLEIISLSGNKFKNLNIFFNSNNESKFPQIRKFSIGNNELSDLSGIKKMVKIKSLNLSTNKLKNINELKYLTKIENLNLSLNSLKNIESIQYLKNLQQLNLHACGVKSIVPLRFIPQLIDLNLSGNSNLIDFTPLDSLVNLKTLDLSRTEFSDLKNIQNLQHLEYLNLEKCRFKNLSLIEKMKKLKSLKISFLKEKDVKYLKTLTNLKYLTVTNCEESTMKKLKKELKGVEVK